MGKGAIPLYSFNGQKLSYVEARKKIYIPLYRRAAQLAVSSLQMILDQRLINRLWLMDFDGYDHIAEKKSFEDVVNDPNMKMGHAFVIWGMLTGVL
jgi:hypothetical protein